MKIRIKYHEHQTHPIHVWHPHGRGESVEELTIDEAKELRNQLVKALKHAEPITTTYECLICNTFFDTRTGPGKMHMANHGYNLKGALELGKARIVKVCSDREEAEG